MEGPQHPTAGVMGARYTVPGNAEFVVFGAALLAIGIIALVLDSVDGHDFVIAATWITAAYLISRGIAKASRVLER
jgi:hypothetical protein